MLSASTVLKQNILNLNPTSDEIEGITNFVTVIANYMNQVQGGPMGTPGIFMLDNAAMVAGLSSLMPVSDNSWVSTFTTAWQTACETAIITPGTVTNPIWTISAVDIATLPIGAATITTIPAAAEILMTALNNAKPDSAAPQTMADGFHDATLDFIFTCIGIALVGIVPTPIPIPTQAE